MSKSARQGVVTSILPLALRRVFPDFVPVRACKVAIPLYQVRLIVEVLAAQHLSHFATYVLHAVGLDVVTPKAIAHLFGVEESDLAPATVELLKFGYVEQGPPTLTGERRLALTASGRKAVTDEQAPPIPRRRSCRLHLNALTGTISAYDDTALSLEMTAKYGVYVLHTVNREAPTLGQFDVEAVAEVLAQETSFAQQTLIDILQLKDAVPQYLPNVDVYLLRHPETHEERVAVMRSTQHLVAESVLVQELVEKHAFSFPEAVDLTPPSQADLAQVFSPSVASSAAAAVQWERRAQELEARVQELEAERTRTLDRQEREHLQAELVQVTDELGGARREVETLREELRQQHVDYLRTEQHRAVLKQALREAQQEVIIISPWMNRRACDDEFCQLVANAIARGVSIRIGHGMGRERTPDEEAYNRHNVQDVRRALLDRISPERQYLLQFCETAGTHQKILICDRKFAVSGSFNWLSYRGDLDYAYRSETSMLVHHPEQVAALAALAEEQLTGRHP